MASITATFVNNTDTARECGVYDENIQPEQTVFDAVLGAGAATPPLTFETNSDIWGRAGYQVYGGARQTGVTVNDGDTVNMA